MAAQSDWLWDIIACPECASALGHGSGRGEIRCTDPQCDYGSKHVGRLFDLLPKKLDRFQMAEHDFRVDIIQERAQSVSHLQEGQYTIFELLNVITFHSFTSQYAFFRDHFVKAYQLSGRGLEIGGATGQLSGFIKLFYPETEMVTSDVAPVNVETAVEMAKFLNFETDYFVMADAERLPFFPDSFDFLASSGMLHHVGNLAKTLSQGHAVLKPGGRWYVMNELSIGSIPRMYWNSRWGEKGKWGRSTGIHEYSYTYREWRDHLEKAGFQIAEDYFNRNPKHKLQSWSRALYYALIEKAPLALLKAGVPCEINFVLIKI